MTPLEPDHISSLSETDADVRAPGISNGLRYAVTAIGVGVALFFFHTANFFTEPFHFSVMKIFLGTDSRNKFTLITIKHDCMKRATHSCGART